jgi:hypothetical protein
MVLAFLLSCVLPASDVAAAGAEPSSRFGECLSADADGFDPCCKHCGQTSKPCGDSCIANDKECHKDPGCACY